MTTNDSNGPRFEIERRVACPGRRRRKTQFVSGRREASSFGTPRHFPGASSAHMAGVSSVAAALLLGIALYAWRIGNRQPSDMVQSPSAPEAAITEVATEFLPLPYYHVPMNTGSTVRIKVPATALVSFGLAPSDFREGDGTVLADVLVGEDGLARAVRFVRPFEVTRKAS